jgi:hypothetical protein
MPGLRPEETMRIRVSNFVCLLLICGKAIAGEAESHWAFQPVTEPAIPVATVANPIDAFVLDRLKGANLTPSPAADRRTLIRRLYYTLTGLPPTFDQVSEFAGSADPKAYGRLVDILLKAPQYGEHWGRHWLDVARYSDTKGYVYAREERFWTHAWAYRDWVVNALNSDLAYDRFLRLQLAADQVADRQPGDEAAMGFLTLGRRFLGVNREIIDDRIDVVTRGTMGLTVSCARCHDHKYDPIPTADYYSLFSVFDSSAEKKISLGDPLVGGEAFQKELKKRRDKLSTTLAKRRQESSERARQRVADYLMAQTELHKYPANGFDQIFAKDDLLPAFVHNWKEFLRQAKDDNNPAFVHWHAYLAIPDTEFAIKSAMVTRDLTQRTALHPQVAKAFATVPDSFREVAARYAQLLGSDAFKNVMPEHNSPSDIPDLPIVHSEVFFSSGEVTELYKLQGEVDRWITRAKVAVPQALMMVDRERAVSTRVYLRGNPLTLGDEVPRQFLGLLSGSDRQPFARGSGRLELANAIVDPANPLTARVIVNRVWMHHFGQGLVKTPSDFGLRAETPSHPGLLDWLTTQFIKDGWSLKKLHRRILTSATYRQSSAGNPDTNDDAVRKDPENRFLWRMNQRRLSFEELRDSMLTASHELNRKVGGKPADLFKAPYPVRRTLYGLMDRQFFPSTLRMFDVATPDLHIPKRPETTVPQQALFFMNDPLVLDRTRSIARVAKLKPQAADRVRSLFHQVIQREPGPAEIADSLALVMATGTLKGPAKPPTADDWHYGYGELDEDIQRIANFKNLPHFSGDAWRGGERWPDSKLGWVQLSAQGGHPGNTRKHAAVRRWIAPRDMTIRLESKLIHEPKPGDGIRAFIVSSKQGILQSATIHQKTIPINVDDLKVSKGDTLDFVVDIDKILNSDQYLWRVTIAAADGRLTWDSESDFPPNESKRLTGWEQLAQALLCSNEFMFVD